MSTTSPRPPSAPPPTALTARCPEDLLALVPVLLGFAPARSVVMLTFGAPHPFHARVDLPGSRAEVAEVVDLLLAPALRHRVQRVAFVDYDAEPAVAALVDEVLHTTFELAGIDVADLLHTDGERWWRLLEGRRTPAEGVPYAIDNHPFRAHAVLRGMVTHRSREALADTLAADVSGVRAVGRSLEPPERRPAPGWPRARLLAEGEWVHAVVGGHADHCSSPSDREVARLVAAIVVPVLRDAAWTTLSRTTADQHASFWTDVVRRTPASLGAVPSALLGWSAWLAGHGALAWCAVERAWACGGEEPLAHQLARVLEQAVPPAAWRPVPDWRLGLPAG